MPRSAFILVLQALPAILLVFAGWGFDNVAAFFANPARGGLAIATLAAFCAGILLKVDFDPLRRGKISATHENVQLGGLLFLSLALLWFLPFADRRKILTLQHDYWRYLGVALCCIGIIVRLLALPTLGKQFSAYVTLQPNHRLIQQGIYGSIRHPLYLSLLLIPTGIALVFESWLAPPILLLAAVFVFDRIRKEELLLATHFYAEFEGYRRRTWRLIPWIF
jgi:protein-S-isoprenylcysteine O-methyltransferase Ste14